MEITLNAIDESTLEFSSAPSVAVMAQPMVTAVNVVSGPTVDIAVQTTPATIDLDLGGPTGPPGPNGQTWTVKQQPLETPNGVRTTFTTPSNYVTGSLLVTLNGLEENYITELSVNTFQFDTPPILTDVIYCQYRTA